VRIVARRKSISRQPAASIDNGPGLRRHRTKIASPGDFEIDPQVDRSGSDNNPASGRLLAISALKFI
jgi:hypothetical protein